MYISKYVSTLLKGVAIIFVLLGHRGYIDSAGAWGVHMFLILSGYGLYNSNREGYWKKRISSVYVPYLFVSVIYGIALLLLGKTHYTRIFISILGLDFGLNNDPTMWYISYLFVWYVIYYLATTLNGKKKIIFPGIIFIIMELGALSKIFWHDGTIAWAYLFSFPLGVLLAHLNAINKRIAIKLQYFILFVCACIVVIRYNCVHTKFEQLFFTISAAIFFIVIFSMMDGYLNKKKNKRLLKCLEFIGIYSYGIYLTEGIIIHHLKELFPVVDNKIIQDIYFLITSVVGAVLIMKVVNKIQRLIFHATTKQ